MLVRNRRVLDSNLRRMRIILLKSLRIFVDQATIRVRVIMTKEEGRVMAPMVRRRRKSPPPHSLDFVS